MRIRIIRALLSAGLLSIVVFSAGVTAHAADAQYESQLVDRVERAFGTGSYAASGEPAQTIKCGTPLVYEVFTMWPNLSEATRTRLRATINDDRPVLDETYDFSTPEGSFRIHYTRTGDDAVDMSYGVGEGNVPVYVLKCAAYVDTVVMKEVTDIGYLFPISDQMGNPSEDPRFDIYFTNLGSRFYGITYPEAIVGPPQQGYGSRITSWMNLNSDFKNIPGYTTRPFEAMAVTIAHEFHHSVQWSYDAAEAEIRNGDQVYSWFFELTSTYLEEVVFDYINDYYSYLDYFYEVPWMSLRMFVPAGSSGSFAEQLHCYAEAVFGIYLSQKFGDELMREVWQNCATISGFNTFRALDDALKAHGSSFADAWAEFLVWNYFTGNRSQPWAFEEGSNYPEVPDDEIAEYDEYPVNDKTSSVIAPRSPDELGATYFRFIPGLTGTSEDFKMQLNPDGFTEWMIITAGLKSGLEPEINYTRDIFNPVTVAAWEQYDQLLVIVSPFRDMYNQNEFSRTLGFSYDVDSLASGTQAYGIQKVYSNPLHMTAGTGEETFQVDVALAEPVDVSMYIYTTSGQLVRGGKKDGMAVEAGPRSVRLRWAGVNRDDEHVASGIYLALVKIGDKEEVIKVAVINDN